MKAISSNVVNSISVSSGSVPYTRILPQKTTCVKYVITLCFAYSIFCSLVMLPPFLLVQDSSLPCLVRTP